MALKKEKDKSKIPVVKRSLASWILEGNVKLQILLLTIIPLTVAIRVVPLEMQKRIVNEAINLRKLDLLGIYCGIYLAAVVSASIFKLIINIIQTKISQKVTAQMRKQLYHHILTMPLNFFRNTQPGTVVNSLINELTIPGNFVGMAVAVPLTNIVTLLAFAGYLIVLNPILGIVSFSIYPVMLYVIPLLQKFVNRDNKKRVNTSRKLSSRIVESVSGIHEVQANGAFEIENNKYDNIVDSLMKIRIKWSIYKFSIKVVSNFFINMGPFLIFIIGGYLAIKGQLGLGTLVAFLSAQEKLYDPWKELIEFYQVYQDGSVNYYKTMNYFDVEIENELTSKDREPYELDVSINVENMSLETKEGVKLLDDVSLKIAPGEHIALVGFSGSGKSSLALCLAQLYKYTSGHATIDNVEISDLTKADITKNVGLVSQSPFIFDGTIKENLMYSYTALHGETCSLNGECKPELDGLVHVLQQSGLFVDVLRFGLNTIVDNTAEEFIPVIIKMRENFQKEFGDTVGEWVEFFDEKQFFSYANIADNIIFGASVAEEFKNHKLVKSAFFLEFIDDADLTRPLLALGKEIADQTVDILKNVSHDKMFFEQSPIKLEEFEKYETIVTQIKNKNLHQINKQQKTDLLELALRFSPGKHRIAILPEFMINLILEGRYMFRERIMQKDPHAVAFFRNDQYIHSQTIFNNILFGIVKTTNPGAREKINQFMVALLIGEDFLEKMIEIGMNFEVGTKGNNLSGGQQQKLAISRIFLKSPPIMILDEATSALDNISQKRIQNVLSRHWKGKSTLIAVVHRLDIVKEYDKVAFLKAGKIVEMGTYDELMDRKGYFYGLVNEQK
ncbi:MAG: ABC transporter ATP-binding protein/permease [Desulfobacula sp.]|uniref:ABC transporter ATP-binding protein/permease n=1 Tax=Desulfobacula sp. TaxID=2593537 RepID=UPI0025BCFEDA|nr:ABC transporter ATP-binding protein/permease [Desulfobacula sp.]MCD4720961.1 ABC transporter ATP-binding protein/permease [Desulfobacula sp.]